MSSKIESLQDQTKETNAPLKALELRSSIHDLGLKLLKEQTNLRQIERPLPSSSRACYLVSLERLMPLNPSRHWHDEWDDLTAAHHRMIDESESRQRTERDDDESLKKMIEKLNDDIEYDMEKGWPREDSTTMNLLQWRRAPLMCALKERDGRFSSSIHALTDAFLVHRERTRGSGLMPPCYRNLHGIDGLVSNEPEWADIEIPDRNGFRGFCARGITKATCDLDRFEEGGFRAYNYTTDQMIVQDSAVVCFESVSGQDGDHIVRDAIHTHDTASAYPPNTLFRLVGVEEEGFELPNGLRVRQRLLTVRSSYVVSRPETTSCEGSKLCSGLLSYAGRDAFVDGLDDIVELPMLTMAQEFDRDLTWTDWKGVSYHLREEWKYVNGPAIQRLHCTPGTRDANNAGKTPQTFRSEVNQHIRSRRAAGHGILLHEDHALLSIDEVLAIRLYTGPCYQILNDFLRQVSRMEGRIRTDVIRSPTCTFAATVGHVCNAIRKLAAIATEEEATRPLFRGVRGELPRATWIPDEKGLVCVVDTAFMSTSGNRRTPIEYMQCDGVCGNVLWEIQPKEESDVAFHCGANVSMLSQFVAEEEVLFPPCTMLLVSQRDRTSQSLDGGASDHVLTQMLSTLEVEEKMDHGKAFLAVQVVPHFV